MKTPVGAPSLTPPPSAGGWMEARLAALAGVPLSDAVNTLSTDTVRGLSAQEAAVRLARAGPNEPAPPRGPLWPRTLLRQFGSKLILLLVVTSAIAALLGEWTNAAAIGVTALVSGGFGFFNEYRSERAIAALRRLTARTAEVIRDGLHEELPAASLVPGDLLVLSEGDAVPADARVVESRGLLVNESILTGEPEAVPKAPTLNGELSGATPATALYAGTTVVAGGGLALVVSTGRDTSLGSIAVAVARTERRATPLEERLEALGNRLIVLFLALCAVLVLLGVLQGREPRLVVEMAVSLAIGAVPEGLPAVATIALAVAVRRLATRKVLVRRLDAVETLGSTTVIVSDKTGTLTENRMVVRRILLVDGRCGLITTTAGPGPDLTTVVTDEAGMLVPAADRTDLERVLLLAALCNDAVAEYDDTSGWHTHGDPSEAALMLAATGLGFDLRYRTERYPRVETEAFTSSRRMMRTHHLTAGGRTLTALKGAYQEVAALDPGPHPLLDRAVHRLGEDGFRVFTVAEATNGEPVRVKGAVVLEDPLRVDAADAVRECQALGVRLLLATGDQHTTAARIGTQTGILRAGDRTVTGSGLDLDRLDGVAVIARATHTQKEALVRTLQAQGEVVAMTGDGVNDAGALRAADVGIAIGPNATDVAVEAAAIVVSDGRLASLVHGIAAGRQVSHSLRAGMLYLFTASFATILLVTLSMAAVQPLPLSPLQILWLNIVVHVFPALALATGHERAESASAPTRVLMTTSTWLGIGWRALLVALAGLAALLIGDAEGTTSAQTHTLVFITIAVGLVGQAFLIEVCSTAQQQARLRRPALWGATAVSMALLLVALYLPGLARALGMRTPGATDWLIGMGCAGAAWLFGQAGVVLGERALHPGGLLRRQMPDR
jgi:P-type Ca2+ transporter type 2C